MEKLVKLFDVIIVEGMVICHISLQAGNHTHLSAEI